MERPPLPLGIKVILAFHLFNLVIWLLGQTGAVVAYDTVATWGLQEPRDQVDPALVAVNRGIGLADTIVMLPLFGIAIVGLLRRRFFGAVASWLVFGMTLYWPVVYWCTQWFHARAGVQHVPVTASTVILPAFLLAIAMWGSWYLAVRREIFGRP